MPDDRSPIMTVDQWNLAEWHGTADESALYHRYELNYAPPTTASGRPLARR